MFKCSSLLVLIFYFLQLSLGLRVKDWSRKSRLIKDWLSLKRTPTVRCSGLVDFFISKVRNTYIFLIAGNCWICVLTCFRLFSCNLQPCNHIHMSFKTFGRLKYFSVLLSDYQGCVLVQSTFGFLAECVARKKKKFKLQFKLQAVLPNSVQTQTCKFLNSKYFIIFC